MSETLSEQRLRSLIEGVMDYAILQLDRQGLVASWTAFAERTKGYRAEEILGKSFACFYTPEDVERGHPDEVLRIAAEVGHFEEDGWRVRQDGSRFWASVMITALRDEAGQVTGFSKMTRDITERKRDEEKVRESEQKFRAVLESAPDAMLIVEGTGKIALVNAQLERLFGYRREELVGQPMEILIPVPSRVCHAHLRSEWNKNPRPRPMNSGMVLKGLRRDGAEFPVEVSLSPIETANSSWVVAAIRDVTERRTVELQLVAERRRAEDANRTKSAFLATMSHEIRTPMNAILGMSDLLWESDLDPEQRRFVEIFRRAGASLLRLINHLLDLSKIEAGHFELEKEQFNLEDVLDQVSELIGGRARRKGIALLVRLAPDVATDFIGDPGRLRQALLNLVGNAVKFTDKGEVTVTAQSQQSSEPGRVSFAVSDTGIGIPADKLDVIFDDFTQADSSVTRKYGGTGLGLGITKRIVERMGGRIFAISTPGEGSTFVFTALFEPVAPDQLLVRQEVDDLQGCRVLVVDDSCTSRLILRETLGSWALESNAFGTAAQALQELARAKDSHKPYSLVILDNRPPDMSCVELSAAIREIEPAVPLIILSSGASACDTVRPAVDGLSGYALKPVKRSDMLRLICQAMGRSKNHEPVLPSSGSSPLEQADRDNPVRILVAEDSPDNRILVQAYLKGGAYDVTFVEDGQAAVEEFSIQSFDLVLMDVQMPVMDGLTATRTIREFERSRGNRATPIVALTAHASQRDTEMSVEAGCDSHLSKPISKSKLVATIEKYGRSSRLASLPAEPIPIRVPEGLEELVPPYLASRREEVRELKRLLAAGDFESLSGLAHNLKGSGESYGFSDLTRLGRALESSSKDADGAAVQGLLEQLDDYLSRVQLVKI
jgi:PAS domain S-box-containing protein